MVAKGNLMVVKDEPMFPERPGEGRLQLTVATGSVMRVAGKMPLV